MQETPRTKPDLETIPKIWAQRVLKRTGLESGRLNMPTGVSIALRTALCKFAQNHALYEQILARQPLVDYIADTLKAHLASSVSNSGQKNSERTLYNMIARRYDDFLAKENEKRVGLLYETKDDAYELIQIYHKTLFGKVARQLENCLDNKLWRDNVLVGTGAGRGKNEILVLRTRNKMPIARHGTEATTNIEAPYAIAAMQYVPQTGTLKQVEGSKRPSERRQFVPIPREHQAFKPAVEVAGAMVRGDVPGIVIKERIKVFDHIFNESSLDTSALLDTGELKDFTTSDLDKIVTINRAQIDKTTSWEHLQKACEHARTLDMTHATAEQKNAIVEVQGTLIDRSGVSVTYTHLTSIHGNIQMQASRVSFPTLKSVRGDEAIFALAEKVLAPEWRYFTGTIKLKHGAQLETPVLAKNPKLKIENLTVLEE